MRSSSAYINGNNAASLRFSELLRAVTKRFDAIDDSRIGASKTLSFGQTNASGNQHIEPIDVSTCRKVTTRLGFYGWLR
jgi:hypothetical protein